MAGDLSHTTEIERMRKDAQDLLRALHAEQFPDDDAIRTLRAQVEQGANDVISAAEAPVTLGIVGEFSVGKSLLLGTMLGRPDLLPVEDRATTGNVTALHLRPGSLDEPTRFDGDPEICYMSESELTECVRRILDHLVSHYRQVLQRDLPELDGYDPVKQNWDRLVTVCKRLWGPDSSGNPNILKTAEELLRIRAAHLSGKGLLGMVVTVPDARVRRAAVELGSSGEIPDTYPEFPVGTASTFAVRSDDNALRISFPLIKRVTYKVTVNAKLWPLDSLRGANDEVVLLDFPGLTASRSARRDEYLSSAELKDVHTIITVFSMRKPDTQTPHDFRSMLEQHGRQRTELEESILAVGNRFDEIDIPAALATGPVTFGAIRDAVGSVGRFVDTARALVGRQGPVDRQDAQIVIVSAVAAISHYKYPVSFQGEEQERLEAAVGAAPKSMASWGEVGRRLALSEPKSHWADVLTEYGKDGGLKELRSLVEDHAAKHGLVNKHKVVERADRRLREQLPQLERALSPEHGSPGEDEAARRTLGEVFDEFRRMHREISTAARDFRDPMQITMQGGSQLLGSARDRAVTAVFTWPYWQTLMLRAERGYVRKGTRRVSKFGQAREEETSRTFLDAYRTTLIDTVEWSRAQFAEAVLAWVDTHNGRLADLRDRLADPDVMRALDAGLARLRAAGDTSEYLMAMQHVADLRVLLDVGDDGKEPGLLTEACPSRSPADDEITASYPLFIGVQGTASAALPWHPDVPEKPGESDQRLVRHQVYVFRLRRQLATGVADAAVRRLTGEVDQFYKTLRERLEDVFNYIPGPDKLRQMFPPDPGSAEASDAAGDPAPPEPTGSPVRELLREWAGRPRVA
jgi:hypothetical protein